MELLITAPGIRGAHVRSQLPPSIKDIELVSKLTILGVVVNDRLSAGDHVTSIIASCFKSLYALRVLMTHGMPASALHKVFRATVMTKLTYCSSAWAGFCSATDRGRLDSFIRWSKRFGNCAENVVGITEQFEEAEDSLLRRILSIENHTLYQLISPRDDHGYNICVNDLLSTNCPRR